MNVSMNIGILKATQDKIQRQSERDNKIAFYEAQKENLKNMQSVDIDVIERKLELYHSYEEQIAMAKLEYNNEQKQHTLDEAKEFGEKLAEASEEKEIKTDEERKNESIKDALGIEADDEGLLSRLMDDYLFDEYELSEEESYVPFDARV